ncbi:E3 ubiquitin-protein ligase TRIM45-like [Saccostrea echinata]|uniref:E3 ubiquitin-protein ligase TRIM45-like n=1 Tax=Saccostrea echinata TaxID=191078 RepID=UPI002A82130F|nr:E3 ubiquitin-protein ligase TRIM45-like [Saccostrea echinata]
MDSGFAQHFIECTTCDSNAQFHCNTCQFNLCQDCRDRHQQRKETSNHDVVPYIQRKERAACERCKFHPDKIYEACCKPCEMPVCMKCVQEVHNGHKLTNIEGVFKAKMNELMFLVRHLRDESLTESTTLATQIEQNKKKCKREIAKIRSDLRSTAQEIKNLVDVILQEKNQNLTDIEASLMLELQSQEKKMQNFISEIKIFLKEHEAKGPISSSVEFILTHNERVDAIKRMTDVPELPEVSPPRHQQKTLERNDVEKLFGNITEQSLKFNIKRHTGSASKSHATSPRGDPGNALLAKWQWQKASVRRLEITGTRG